MIDRLVVTTRAGGVSSGPYATLNLAGHVGDDPAAVAANRRRLASRVGVDSVMFMEQAHGARVATVGVSDLPGVEGVDAMVTAAAGCALAVLAADCVPVALAGRRAVGVAHAGRRGLVAGIVPATVAALRELDDGPLEAYVGPAVCGRCYEVPPALHDEVVAAHPAARATTRRGATALDLPAAVMTQLQQAGVAVQVAATCTYEDGRYFSYRRDGVTGRHAVVVRSAG